MAQEEEVVVWEWFSDHGRWKAYDPSVVQAIEANSSSGTTFGLGEVDPSLSLYAIDFSSNRQIRTNTGKVRPIRRSTFPASSAPGKGIQWQWLDDTGWSAYDITAANIVEEAYAQGKSSLDLSQTNCHLPYVVDYTNMEQTRKGTGFQRQVQRVTLNPSYPKVQGAEDISDDGAVATVTTLGAEGAASSKDSVTISIEKAPSTVTRPTVLVSSSSTLISDEVSTTESATLGTNPTPASGARASKRVAGKRTGSRKAVAAATSGVQATVAWSTPPGSSSGASSTTVSSSAGSSLPRSSSVPGGMGPEVTTTPSFASTLSASSSSSSSGPTLSHSATTSCLAAAAAVPSRMTRSQSTPCNITAKPAHAAGAKLSPIMTAITSMLLSTAVPIKVNPTPIPVFTPPPTSRGGIRPVDGVKPSRKKRKTSFSKVDNAEDVLKNYVKKIKKPPDEDCPICYEKLGDTSHFSEESAGEDAILNLNNCNHMFHQSCLHAMYNSGPKDGSIQCPTCKAIYGTKHGNQPPGRMDYHVIPHSLPTYDDCGTIRIIYDIPPGTQGEEHPNPGKRYSARGFPRHCYLPDNPIGQKILKLLVIAWERHLLFTIGTSATTGEPNTVVWNEIHHKTEFGSNVTGHGFPDPNYFDNILSELSAQGVTEDCLDT